MPVVYKLTHTSVQFTPQIFRFNKLSPSPSLPLFSLCYSYWSAPEAMVRFQWRKIKGLICKGHRTFAFSNSSSSDRLEGKVALITGAASGIGKATATKFIQNGAKVVITDIQHKLGQDIANQLGPQASFVECDVTKESQVSDAVDYAVSKHGRLDIMYNNAGVPCMTPPSIVDLDLSVFDRVMAINVRGVLTGIKHASRVMIPQQKGCILCTASITGILGGSAQHTYSISKSSVVGVIKSVASELSKHGIRINCISPYAVFTPFVEQEMRMMYPGLDDRRLKKVLSDSGELKGEHCEEIDVANAALYLASDEAKYVSGHNLVVDGGFTSFKRLEFPSPDQLE